MITLVFPLTILILGLCLLYGLSVTLDRFIMRMLGRGWYLATMWPGVIVHELSHLTGCLITFTKVVEVKLFAPSGETLGYVSHVKTQNPIKNIIISIAPLFGVSLVIAGIMQLLIPDTYSIVSNLNLSAFSSPSGFIEIIKKSFTSLAFGNWQTYLALYLLITLSSHAAPSRIDLKHAATGFAGLLVLFILIWFLSTWTNVSISLGVVNWLENALGRVSHTVIIACSFSLILLCLVLIPALLKKIIRPR